MVAEAVVDQARRMLEAKAEEERIEVANRVGGELDGAVARGDRGGVDGAGAITIVLSMDAVERIRRALALATKNSPNLPLDAAYRLAHDDSDRVAAPMVRDSPVFDEERLARMVMTVSPRARVAMARRGSVSSKLARVLVDVGGEETAPILAANETAEVDSGTLAELRTRCPNDSRLDDGPKMDWPSVDEALAGIEWRQTRKHQLAYVNELHSKGALTAEIACRALERGHTMVFEAVIALLSGQPARRVHRAIARDGLRGAIAMAGEAGIAAQTVRTAWRASITKARKEPDSLQQRAGMASRARA